MSRFSTGFNRVFAGLVLLGATSAALASDAVLVPVFFGGPGAQGSAWRSSLTIVNNSALELPGLTVIRQGGCVIPEGCDAPLPAGATYTAVASSGGYRTGLFLSPGVQGADVSYSLRIFDDSRGTLNFGTQIPVVKVDEFSTERLQMPDVPAGEPFRMTLRVYGLPGPWTSARVRVFEDSPLPYSVYEQQPAPKLLAERSVVLAQPQFAPPTPQSWAPPPAVVISDLLSGIVTTSSRVRVEVQSVTPSHPIWAFVTVTNNETQFVTVIAPYRSPQS